MKIAIYFPKNIKIFIYINHTLHIFKKKCTRMDRDPTFERASMRNKLLSGPRAHGTPSACHSPTRRGGRRALATVVCFARAAQNAARRTRPCGAARFVGYLCRKAKRQPGRRSHGRRQCRNDGASDLASYRGPPGIPILSAVRKHPVSVAASRICGLGSEFPGEWLLCRQARWLRSQVATAQA